MPNLPLSPPCHQRPPTPPRAHTPQGPSSEALHLGHLVPFMFTKYLQVRTGRGNREQKGVGEGEETALGQCAGGRSLA